MDEKQLLSYFEGKTTNKESHQITTWLEADTSHMNQYLGLCRIYEISLWKEQEVQLQVKPRKTWSVVRYELMRFAAIFILVFGLMKWIESPSVSLVEMQTIYVPPGQNAQLLLADGSKVWLNAGSKLHFPTQFTGDTRQVSLEGEAFFDVETNPEFPFLVSAGGYEVKAIGTSFNVCAYDKSSKFNTSLLSGCVEINSLDNKQKIILFPNQSAMQEEGSLISMPIENLEYFRWREGILCFDESIAEVFTKLEIYFDVNFHVKNKKLLSENHHCIGKFRSRDGIEHILKVLQLSHKFSYHRDDDNQQQISIY